MRDNKKILKKKPANFNYRPSSDTEDVPEPNEELQIPDSNECSISELELNEPYIVQFSEKDKEKWWSPEDHYDPSIPHKVIVVEKTDRASLIKLFTPNGRLKVQEIWFDALDIIYCILDKDSYISSDLQADVDEIEAEDFFKRVEKLENENNNS